MIYEMRTYDIKPRSLPEVEKRFGEAYEKRKKYSELAAFWHTEIGPLNQIIHVWGYKDLEERNKIREAAVKRIGIGLQGPSTFRLVRDTRAEIGFADGMTVVLEADRDAERRERTMRLVYPSGVVEIDFLARTFRNDTAVSSNGLLHDCIVPLV